MTHNSRLDFRCITCGGPACYGDGVHLLKGEAGVWHCAAHVPAGFLPGAYTVRADYHDGVLTVHVPKPEETKPKRISISRERKQIAETT